MEFFKQEYKLNHLLGTLKKPIITILDGITMGGLEKYWLKGGVGISVHGHFRIITENWYYLYYYLYYITLHHIILLVH